MIIRIGIDPGSNTGLAVVETTQPRALLLATVPPEIAAPLALGLALDYNAEVVIEEPQVAHVYARQGQGPGAMRKIALNVGQCRERAHAIKTFLDRHGVRARLVAPIKQGTKWPEDQFQLVFKWQAKSSSHSRDAAVIAWRGEA